MLMWAVIFLIVAIIAGIFGFTGVANVATQIAKVLFFIFLVLFIVSLIYHYMPKTPVGKGMNNKKKVGQVEEMPVSPVAEVQEAKK